MATADCGCILTLYLILCRRCAPRSTKCVPLTDEDVTLTKRTSAGNTQQVVLCVTHTCPVTLTFVRDRERYTVARKRASERFVLVLCACHLSLAVTEPNRQSRFDCVETQGSGSLLLNRVPFADLSSPLSGT